MNVSIIIPAYNAERTVGKTLEACLNQDYKGEFEVVVVDDGSTDNTKNVVKNYSVQYIFQKNAGPATARNRGWKTSRGEIVCFTDSDCIPLNNWLSTLLRHYRNDVHIDAVCGSYEIANPKNLLAQCIQDEIVFKHSTMPKDVRFFGSYNFSIKRSVLEQVGGFDETFTQASGEDNDLSYRIKKGGYRMVFDRNALVAHHHRESLYRYLKDQYVHGYWRAKLYVNHPDMSSGDDYTQWKDILEVPLCMVTMATAPLIWIPHIGLAFMPFLILNYLFQFKLSLQIYGSTKGPSHYLFSIVTFLRSFARTLGFVKGILIFRCYPLFRRV